MFRHRWSDELHMEVRLHIAPVLVGEAPNNSNALGEGGQLTQPAEGGAFAALFKRLAQNTSGEEISLPADSEDPTELTPLGNAQAQAILFSVIGGALASNPAGEDKPVDSSAETDRAESSQNAQHSFLQGFETISFVLQDSPVQIHEGRATEQDSGMTQAALPTSTDLSSHPALVPLIDPAQSSEAPMVAPKQIASQPTGESPIRHGRAASVDLAAVPLDLPPGSSALPSTPPPNSLIADQWPSPVMENQEARNFLPAASVNGGVQSHDRPSTGIQPSAIIQEQGAQGATLLGHSLSVPVIGESGGGEQDPFGADAHGEETGTLFHSKESGVQESVVRGSQPPLFIDQFTSARQTQPTLLGAGSPTVTSSSEQLKMTQAFLGEDHSATMTSAPGMAQTVHLNLPSHDSGPLSVRISMTDQTVHTQFTTDRSDLGQFLLTRQDQLQQNLTKSGLELGQFQVHIDQQGQQDGPAERQSRGQGEAREDNRPPHHAEQQDPDKKRQHARPIQALSVFA